MKYGDIELKVRFGHKVYTTRKSQDVRHYPGTNKADIFDLGKSPTEITVSIVTHSEGERLNVEALLHDVTERNLEVGYRLYKQVVPGEASEWRPMDPDEDTYFCDVTFIALDPVPYDAETEERLY